ncbi:hypothetical protein [Natronoglycomyces albus]|uniref:Uncharacterized protein n=1 Tax=Natronoglycomyces albus TaxID=2811108 RepID=A0A895XSQ5_9ACTN|nr:hypothetical protein [Natronoglycomyces albus]QSB06275.1 hypothetical protein JQS30_05035 [Natronoglycomyces albus]
MSLFLPILALSLTQVLFCAITLVAVMYRFSDSAARSLANTIVRSLAVMVVVALGSLILWRWWANWFAQLGIDSSGPLAATIIVAAIVGGSACGRDTGLLSGVPLGLAPVVSTAFGIAAGVTLVELADRGHSIEQWYLVVMAACLLPMFLPKPSGRPRGVSGPKGLARLVESLTFDLIHQYRGAVVDIDVPGWTVRDFQIDDSFLGVTFEGPWESRHIVVPTQLRCDQRWEPVAVEGRSRLRQFDVPAVQGPGVLSTYDPGANLESLEIRVDDSTRMAIGQLSADMPAWEDFVKRLRIVEPLQFLRRHARAESDRQRPEVEGVADGDISVSYYDSLRGPDLV